MCCPYISFTAFNTLQGRLLVPKSWLLALSCLGVLGRWSHDVASLPSPPLPSELDCVLRVGDGVGADPLRVDAWSANVVKA
jgi:hypothetical protein